jgi:hypothetical protein
VRRPSSSRSSPTSSRALRPGHHAGARQPCVTWHRDHKHHPAIKLHRFSLGLLEGDKLIGAIIVSFPMARMTDLHQVAEECGITLPPNWQVPNRNRLVFVELDDGRVVTVERDQ